MAEKFISRDITVRRKDGSSTTFTEIRRVEEGPEVPREQKIADVVTYATTLVEKSSKIVLTQATEHTPLNRLAKNPQDLVLEEITYSDEETQPEGNQLAIVANDGSNPMFSDSLFIARFTPLDSIPEEPQVRAFIVGFSPQQDSYRTTTVRKLSDVDEEYAPSTPKQVEATDIEIDLIWGIVKNPALLAHSRNTPGKPDSEDTIKARREEHARRFAASSGAREEIINRRLQEQAERLKVWKQEREDQIKLNN